VICELGLGNAASAAPAHALLDASEMDEFLNRVREELILRRYSRKTAKVYLGALRKFIGSVGKAPEEVEESDLRDYLVAIAGTSKDGVSKMRQARNAARFAFRAVFQRDIAAGLGCRSRSTTRGPGSSA